MAYTQAQVAAMFASAGVPLDYNSDGTRADPNQRLATITAELNSGARTVTNLQTSLSRLGQQVSSFSEQQARDLFDEYEVPLDYNSGSSTETSQERLDRIVREIRSGTRTIDSLRSSLSLLSQARVGDRAGEDADQAVDGAGQDSAFAILRDVLARYGLETMANWVEQEIRAGRSMEEILIDMREHSTFKERFKAIDIRRQNGLNAVSPEEVIEYENTARDLMRRSGLPSGFYDEFDDFAELIGKGVSLQSVAQRVEQSWDRVVNAPQEVRDAFGDLYGVRGDQALAALMFDPDKAETKLEEMARSAVAGGAMRAAGFGMDAITAGRLAGFDFEDQTVRAGFARLAQLRAVFTETMGERNEQDLDAMREGINSVFDIGQGAEAMERRVQTRINAFGGGGGSLLTQTGLAGVADA